MKEIRRQDLMDIEDYAEIFNKESHHAHRVIEDEHGTLRWEAGANQELRTGKKTLSGHGLLPQWLLGNFLLGR